MEGTLRFGVGAHLDLAALLERDGVETAVALFSESAGRAVVSVPRGADVAFADLCTARGVPVLRLGETSDDGELVLEGPLPLTLSLDELREAHRGTLPRYFGAGA